MNRTKSIFAVASISLALVFTISCSSDDGDEPSQQPSSGSVVGDPSSSSAGQTQSSSSEAGVSSGSSSSGGTVGSFTDSRDNKTYRTVLIGDQTWMTENLAVAGGKCYGEGGQIIAGYYEGADDAIFTELLPVEIQANCAKYGRLYDWATAMGFGSDCNENECAGQVQSKHKGICPEGWHIPSKAEWNRLYDFADSECIHNDTWGECPTAGKHLKATSGWNEDGNDGLDTHNFSALPGGYGHERDRGSFSENHSHFFLNVGYVGGWWGSGENYSDENDGGAYTWFMGYGKWGEDGEVALWGWSYKTFLHSVRCIKD